MKYLAILFLISCASDPKLRQTLHEKKLAGYWSNGNYANRGDEKKYEHVNITCRGTITYWFENYYYKLVGDDIVDGTIVSVDDYTIRYKNWTQFKTTDSWHVTPPSKPGGCWKLSFRDHILYTPEPKDCTKPDETLVEVMQRNWAYASGEKERPSCDELR